MKTIQCCEGDHDSDGNCLRHRGFQIETEFAPLWMVGRGRGKTTDLLQWVTEAPEDEIRIFVTFKHEEAMRILRRARDLDLDVESWQFVSWDEIFGPGVWSGVRYANREKRIVLGIDNLDIILRNMVPWEVGVATLSTRPAPVPVEA